MPWLASAVFGAASAIPGATVKRESGRSWASGTFENMLTRKAPSTRFRSKMIQDEYSWPGSSSSMKSTFWFTCSHTDRTGLCGDPPEKWLVSLQPLPRQLHAQHRRSRSGTGTSWTMHMIYHETGYHTVTAPRCWNMTKPSAEQDGSTSTLSVFWKLKIFLARDFLWQLPKATRLGSSIRG